LINVTAFFRDAPSWQSLAEKILPRILENKGANDPIRCWSAGCASGEEAYTLAMLLAEALGDQQFRQRVKIYATDVDEESLAQARLGSYSLDRAADIPEELLGRYFESAGDRRVFRADLRRALIFGRHDLLQDAAISRLDLLICRNTLMYFNSETQTQILSRFHFALNPGGYLFLGKAETLLSQNNGFRPEELKSRIFQRVQGASLRDRLLSLPQPPASAADSANRPARAREAAFDSGPVAQIAVDFRGQLVLANDKARRLFGLDAADLGRLLQDLELSYRPAELRSRIDSVMASRMGMTMKDVEWRPVGGEPRTLEIQVLPLLDGGALAGVSVSFLDLTVQHQLRHELERANQELETAYEELQSANEELETTNEELQSTNEELETMNEELQSMNDELHSTNEELRVSTGEVAALNRFMGGVLGSFRAGVVVVDADLRVLVWNSAAEDLWGLRQDEVQGRYLLSLDIGLPAGPLHPLLRRQIGGDGDGHDVVELDAVNRRGRPVRVRVTV
ncbi:MAG TPA: CheR family methyltransferase, partial [Thermoanaerobaculia bacterium]|nr:CheR family methyltransferase [Thermoanaerobaculia bacterium]